MTSFFLFGSRLLLSAASTFLFFQTGHLFLDAAAQAGTLSLQNKDLLVLASGMISALIGFAWGWSVPLEKFMVGWASEEKESIARGSLFLDSTALMDPRLGDLAASHLLDMRLVLASSVKQEIDVGATSFDETLSQKAVRAQELLAKLEGMPSLKLRHLSSNGKTFLELVESHQGIILAADSSRLGAAETQPICMINTLAQIMRPPLQGGEYFSVKVQRLGKEPQQGVGYLDDGSMVVVNGAAEFLGETVRVQVLSVKYTANGRLIFCNLPSDETSSFGKKGFTSPNPQHLFVS